MVTASNGQVRPAQLPELPSADSIAQSAQRAKSLPDAPAKVTDSDGQRVSRWTTAAIAAALSGGSLLHTQPPSLHQTWTRHQQSARHYQGWLLRWPRYAWGAVHTALKAVLHVVEWVTDSPPKLLVTAALVAACWFWS